MNKNYYYDPNKRNFVKGKRTVRRNKINFNYKKLILGLLGVLGIIVCGIVLVKAAVICVTVASAFLGMILAPVLVTAFIVMIVMAIIYVVKFFKKR